MRRKRLKSYKREKEREEVKRMEAEGIKRLIEGMKEKQGGNIEKRVAIMRPHLPLRNVVFGPYLPPLCFCCPRNHHASPITYFSDKRYDNDMCPWRILFIKRIITTLNSTANFIGRTKI